MPVKSGKHTEHTSRTWLGCSTSNSTAQHTQKTPPPVSAHWKSTAGTIICHRSRGVRITRHKKLLLLLLLLLFDCQSSGCDFSPPPAQSRVRPRKNIEFHFSVHAGICALFIWTELPNTIIHRRRRRRCCRRFVVAALLLCTHLP